MAIVHFGIGCLALCSHEPVDERFVSSHCGDVTCRACEVELEGETFYADLETGGES